MARDLTEFEPRTAPAAATAWFAGWPACRLLGYGVPAGVLRVYVPDAEAAPRVAALLAPVPGVAVVTVRPDLPPGRYVEVEDAPPGWLRPWGSGANDGALADPHPNALEPHAVWVDGTLRPPVRAVVGAHEALHALGLTHSDDPGNLMYGGGLTANSAGLTADQAATAGRTAAAFAAG